MQSVLQYHSDALIRLAVFKCCTNTYKDMARPYHVAVINGERICEQLVHSWTSIHCKHHLMHQEKSIAAVRDFHGPLCACVFSFLEKPGAIYSGHLNLGNDFS